MKRRRTKPGGDYAMDETAAAFGFTAEEPAHRPNPSELWQMVRAEATRAAKHDEMLRGVLELALLRHSDLASALAALLPRKLAEPAVPAERIEDLATAAMKDD